MAEAVHMTSSSASVQHPGGFSEALLLLQFVGARMTSIEAVFQLCSLRDREIWVRRLVSGQLDATHKFAIIAFNLHSFIFYLS